MKISQNKLLFETFYFPVMKQKLHIFICIAIVKAKGAKKIFNITKENFGIKSNRVYIKC